nr:hypothetical protein [Tanacetum cinerariifolium]
MHNNIMVAGFRDRPPMLAPGRYPQWHLQFLRYFDTRPNGEALRKCILSDPYKPTTILVQVFEATDDSPAVPEHMTEMWEAIERLQQGESLNIQDVKTNLFWEFGKFTSHDGESMESYYTRFYKLMNEMIRNNLTVTTMQKTYKPTNNNLRTSSNSKKKNMDTTPRYKNDGHSGQFGTQRTVNVVVARENVGSKVVQQSGIQYFNCKEYGHFAKECKKPKRVKDSAYHKEKMLLCKQAEQGVPLQAEQYDWLADTDEEVDEQELEAHYSYMAKIQDVPIADSGTYSEPVEQVQNEVGYNVFANHLQHSEQSESVSNTCLVETDDSNVTPDSPDMCEDDIQNEQNDVESDDERVAPANLIANLKLDVDENKKIQKQLKKANTTLAQELKECKAILAETSKSPGESISVRDSCLVALQTKQAEFEKYKAFNDHTVDYDKLERKLNEAPGQLAHKDTVIREGLKTKAYELSVVKEKHKELIKQSLLTKSHYEALVKQKTKASNGFRKEHEQYIEIQDLKAKLQDKNNAISELKKLIKKGKGKYVDTKFDRPSVVRQPNAQQIPKPSVLEGLSKPVTAQTLPQIAKKAVSNTNVLKPGMYRIDNRTTHTKAPQLPQTVRNTNPRVSTSTGVNHKPTVSKPQLKRNQSRDKVLPNNSQVKVKKTQVEVHPRIPSVSNKIKSVTACKDSLNSRNLNANDVCATYNICLVDSNHFAYVTKILNDVHARTKNPNVVPISTRKPKSQANKSMPKHTFSDPNFFVLSKSLSCIEERNCCK